MNIQNKRIVRKFGAVLNLLAILALAAGIPQASPARTSHTGVPNPAVTGFIAGIASDPESLDPALATSTDALLVTSQIYDNLVSFEDGGTLPKPGLAISWTVTNSGLTWIFNLRPGIQFHDGTNLDASAVAFNILRWWDPANPYHNGSFDYFSYLFGGFKGDPNSLIGSVKALDAAHVAITTTQLTSLMPTLLGYPSFAIASPAAIQAGTLMTTPVGSGAFNFQDSVPGNYIHLDPNTTYWRGAPKINSLWFYVYPDNDLRFSALQNGIIKAAYDLDTTYAISATLDASLKTLWRPSTNTGYMAMNRSHTPLDNLLVRQAIAHAVNRQHILAMDYEPGDQLAKQLLPEDIWGYDPSITDYSYDPVLARSLLVQAGYTHGVTTTLSYRDVPRPYMPDPTAVVNAIHDDLLTVGITITVNLYDTSDLISKWQNGDLDLVIIGWINDIIHPDNYYNPLLCGSSYKGFGPKDTTLCNLIENTLSVQDLTTQLADYKVVSQQVHNSLPLLPIANGRLPLIVRKDVMGLILSPITMDDFRNEVTAKFVYLPVVKR